MSSPLRAIICTVLAFISTSATGSVSHAADYYWNTGDGMWSIGANWSDNPTSGGVTGTVPTILDTVTFNQSTVNGAEIISLDGPQAALGLKFANTGTTLLQSDSTTTRILTIGTGGITVASGAGAVTLGSATNVVDLSLESSATFTNNAATLLTVLNGISSATSGAQTLTITGTGNTTLSGAISNGTATSLGITKNGGGTLTLSGTNTFSGAIELNAGTISVGLNAHLGAANTPISLNGGTWRFSAAMQVANTHVATITAAGFTLLPASGDSGFLRLTGAGMLTLASGGGRYTPSATSVGIDYSGGTLLASGSSIVIQSSSVGTPGSLTSGPFGVGTIFLQNGTGTFRGGNSVGSLTVGNELVITGDSTFSATANGNLTFSGPITIANGTRQITNNYTQSVIFTGVIGDGGNGYGLTWTGTGSAVLAATNTYTGPTTIAHATAAGDVTVDFSNAAAPTTNIINPASSLVLANFGSIIFTGKASTANSQIFNTTILRGQSSISATAGAGGSLAVNLGTINRPNGGGLNFAASTDAAIFAATPLITTNTNGIIAPWMTFGAGNDYATVSAGNIVALANVTFTTESSWTSATTNYTYNTAETLTGNRIAYTLLYSGAAATTDLVSNTLTTNGILNAGTGTLTISSTGGTGALTIGATNELVLAGTQSITITAPIAGNGGKLTKIGAGTLTITSTDPTFNGGINVNTTTLVGGSATGNYFGNNPIYIAPTASFRPILTTAATSYAREISGEGAIVGSGTDQSTTLNMSVIRDSVFAGGFTTNRPPSIAKYGPGTFQLTGTFLSSLNNNPTFTAIRGEFIINSGAISIASNGTASAAAGGTYTLDNTNGNSSKLGNAAALTLNGGNFKYIGNASADSAEIIGVVSAGAVLASNIDIRRAGNQTSTVTAASLTMGAASSLNVIYNSTAGVNTSLIFTTAPALTATTNNGNASGFVRGAFLNGVNFATHGGAGTPIVAFTDYTTGASAGINGNINNVTNTNTVLIDSAMTNQTLSGNVTAVAFKIDGAQTITATGFGLTSTSGVFLKMGAGTATITGGTVTGSGGTDYLFYVEHGTLAISSTFTFPTGTDNFTKAGAGVLDLTGAGTWVSGIGSREVHPAEGVLRLTRAQAGAGGTGLNIHFAGAVVEVVGDSTDVTAALGISNGNYDWLTNGNGGFAAKSMDVGINIGSLSTLTWGSTTNFVSNGRALLFNSATADAKVNFKNPLSLGTTANQMWFREVNVVTGSSAAAYAELSGVISGTNQYHLLKTGAGRLDLTNAANTYAGETIVHSGTLNVNGTLQSLPAPSHGQVSVYANATLGGTGTINRPVTIELGGTLAPGVGVGTLTINGVTSLQSGSNFAVELNGTSFGSQYDQLVIGPSGSISLSNTVLTGSVGFAPLATDMFFIIDNQSSNAVVGTFSGGSTVVLGGYVFNVSYLGDFGTTSLEGGNDVVLYGAAPVPEPHHIFLLAATFLGIVYCVRRRGMAAAPAV